MNRKQKVEMQQMFIDNYEKLYKDQRELADTKQATIDAQAEMILNLQKELNLANEGYRQLAIDMDIKHKQNIEYYEEIKRHNKEV